MIGKFIVRAQDWADEKLRRLTGRITPDMRVVIILVMFVVFGGLSVYMTVAAIYNIGKSDGRELGIEHIDQFRLKNDSVINPFNNQ
ncbi:TraL conjugative transposon family protein [Bacteroides ovatus]|uniref:TraL conjugative transposon family protein n=1 Tax=Bacteroides ovatus TaxID=28116 RepID=UPI0018A0EEB3|nr:TraL conjugative transposon family protein [Bacteroides ovatus]MDC2661288.1 TraL conjugative transposon family protein [Bacteroides ovatus]